MLRDAADGAMRYAIAPCDSVAGKFEGQQDGTALQSAPRRDSEGRVSQRDRHEPEPAGSRHRRAGNRIHAIVDGARDITADSDLRLCKFFGLSDGYFLRLQNAYDMLEAKRRIAGDVAKIKRCKPGRAA
jgi:hypothetical protein